MKIVHIADIHWRGLSRHEEYREAFDRFFKQAKDLNPDVIYVGGDIVHSKTQGISPELIDCLCWWFQGLSDIAPTHVILGNHDGLVLNKDRQDAISPIIEALDNPNIFLYKESGVYPIKGHDGFNWCVFSCFDEEGWENVKPIKGETNIALFHGAVWGSKTDINFSIEGDVTDEFFSGFDFALLGDIHKKQYLDEDRRLAYPGSTIQQNYGEDPGKGFLFWEIENKQSFKSTFYEIPHTKPFITVGWKGSVADTTTFCSKFPNGSRFRIKSENALNQSDSKHLQQELKTFKEATEVVFKSESMFDVSSIDSGLGSFKKKNLRDSSSHKSLMRKYYNDSKVTDSDFEEIDTLIDLYMSQITDDQETLRNARWEINSLKFDNMFSYGKGNVINFENIPGITGIFGKNTRGKSSIIGSLMYGLYNTTDRGSIKNLHIVNSRKNNCSATVDITLNGEPIRIQRSTVKHQTRKGEVYASTSLKMYKLNSDGDVDEDLTEEQRRETEKVLRKLIGTSEDFLMTSLASQGEMNTFIKEGATSRKMILTKFLDLGVFEKMYDIAKTESSDLRSRVRSYPVIDWDEEIDNLEDKIQSLEDDFSEIEVNLKEKRERLSKLNISLAMSDSPDVVTQEEINTQKKEVSLIRKNIASLSESFENIRLEISEKSEKVSKIRDFKNSFPISELREKLESQRDLEKTLRDLEHQWAMEKQLLGSKEKLAKKLEPCSCADHLHTCKYVKQSDKHNKLLKEQMENVEKSILKIDDVKTSLGIIVGEKTKAKIDKYEKLIKKESEISVEISQSQIELNNVVNKTSIEESRLLESKNILEDMMSRVIKDESDPSTAIRSNIVLLKNQISDIDTLRTQILENTAEVKASLTRIKRDKDEFQITKSQLRIYDLFMQATSKKGIPLQIMMSQLPLINAEISKILQGVTGFTVELEASSDSNTMDVFINYGDSRRVIELASGMEKMMSSLAIRVALINVSSLTKTNTLIIDEGFGALDELNIEACTRLLDSLKKWFRNILIISHVDAIKDSVDNSLEIIKNGKDSKVVSK